VGRWWVNPETRSKLNYKSYKMIQMKKYLMTLLFVAAALSAIAQTTIVNDENAEKRAVSGSFSSIKVSGGIDIYLTQGSDEAVVVSASRDKYKEFIITEVKDGVLSVYYKTPEGAIYINGYRKNLRAYISFKTIEKITASGACDIYTTGIITVPSLSLDVSGACDFKGEVKVDNLKVDASGASDVKLSGTAANADLEASGASDLKCYDLITGNCKVSASGASDINITVNKELNVSASGASDVHYKGTCVIKEMRSSGSSSVGKRG
jgi:Putative auto-transporter adhesin, head GIN domain